MGVDSGYGSGAATAPAMDALHPNSWEFDFMGQILRYEAAIDANFGQGYAKEHPELIAACIQHAALGELTAAITRAADAIASS